MSTTTLKSIHEHRRFYKEKMFNNKFRIFDPAMYASHSDNVSQVFDTKGVYLFLLLPNKNYFYTVNLNFIMDVCLTFLNIRFPLQRQPLLKCESNNSPYDITYIQIDFYIN